MILKTVKKKPEKILGLNGNNTELVLIHSSFFTYHFRFDLGNSKGKYRMHFLHFQGKKTIGFSDKREKD